VLSFTFIFVFFNKWRFNIIIEKCFILILFYEYSTTDVVNKLKEYVADINANIEKLDTRGPVSKYVLPDENLRGR
jgi:hypothetical protein